MFKCEGDNILLVLHKCPDLDCLAACSVVNDYLRQIYTNKRVYILDCGSKANFFYKPLEEMATVITLEEIQPNTTVILLDHHDKEFSTLENWSHPEIKEFIIFDHHYTIKGIEEEIKIKVPVTKYIETNKTSTCELLFDFLKEDNRVQISKDIATHLYIGIFSDCMRFLLPITTTIHKKVIELAEVYGATVDEHVNSCASKSVYYWRTFGKWWSDHVQTYTENKSIAIVRIPNEEYVRVTNLHLKPTAFLFDVLMCRGVRHVVAIFQVNSKLWTLKVVSRNEGVIEAVFSDAFKAKMHTYKAYYYKAIKDAEIKAINAILEWEEANGIK